LISSRVRRVVSAGIVGALIVEVPVGGRTSPS
jgi:hypothetical protein